MEKIKQYDFLWISTAIYMLLPVLLFLVGWIKPIFLIILVILFAIYICLRKDEFKRKETIKFKKSDYIKIGIIACLIIVWVTMSGIGGVFSQTQDFDKHNAVLHDLIENDNPVHYNINDCEDGLLVYYIAYYLPAAVIGKLLGFNIANIFLLLWSIVGVSIGVSWIFRITKKISIVPIICLILFGGLDILGTLIMTEGKDVFIISHKEWWVISAVLIQFSSFTTLLNWVPQMFIPALIVTPILYLYRKEKCMNIMFLLVVSTFLWSPFICVGVLPFFIYIIVKQIKKYGIMSIISPEMIGICFILTAIFILYIKSNTNTESLIQPIWLARNIKFRTLVPYMILFWIIEFGIVSYIIKKNTPDKEQRKYLYLVVIVLLVYSCVSGGEYNDFAMRTTIPALIMLYILFIQLFEVKKDSKLKKNALIGILVFILLCMSFNFINEFVMRIQNTKQPFKQYWDDIRTLKNFKEIEIRNQYISTDYKESIFNKYIIHK